MLDHIVSIKNNCTKRISVKVCYYGSDRCVDSILAGLKRADITLGSMYKIASFRYNVFQRGK